MFKYLTIACAFLSVSFNAFAGISQHYSDGYNPTAIKYQNLIVEVHQNPDGYLIYKIGQLQNNQVSWQTDESYGYGSNPSITIDEDTIVEMHTSHRQEMNELYYQVGKIDKESLKITWSSPIFFSFGDSAAISIKNKSLIVLSAQEKRELVGWNILDPKIIIPIYKLIQNIYLTTGQLNTDTMLVDWNSSEFFQNGSNPSLIRDNNTIVTAYGCANKLYYNVGEVHSNKILWGEKIAYDTGMAPRLSMVNHQIMEVHQSEYRRTIWYHLGELNLNNRSINWGKSVNYEDGCRPSILQIDDKVLALHIGSIPPQLCYILGIIKDDDIEWLS